MLVLYIALFCIVLHCIALHNITKHYITLHYIALHYITLHYNITTLQQYNITTLHLHSHYIYIYIYMYIYNYITVHYITLHTLHTYIPLYSIRFSRLIDPTQYHHVAYRSRKIQVVYIYILYVVNKTPKQITICFLLWLNQ